MPYTKLIDRFWKAIKPAVSKLPWDSIAFDAIRVLACLRIGSISRELRPDNSLRTRALWEEAVRRGIELYEFRLFNQTVEWFVARYRGQLMAFEGLPRPHGSPDQGLEWMDDKAIMSARFRAAGIPVARGGSAVLVQKALAIFDDIGGSVIVKPRFGSRSRHTYTNITTRSGLVTAFYSAQKLCPWVVIEEQLAGPVHRALVVAGKLIGVARRDLPQVTGDGVRTVGELVAEANADTRRDNDIFCKLPGERESSAELERQGLSWNSVPAAGQMVCLDWKVNRGSGGLTTDLTDEVHPDNVAIFENVGKLLNDPIVGIDFIAERLDISVHELATAYGVIECNSLPFIDLHHYPIAGKPRNAAGAIWDLIWPQSGVRV